MEITRVTAGDTLILEINGRLDAAWADHFDASLAETVREGHHHLHLDLSRVNFLSSAGIAVLMKFYKQLARIEGSLRVVRPSAQVRTVLEITRLVPILVESAPEETVDPSTDKGRVVEFAAGRVEVFDLAPGAKLKSRTIGSEQMLARAEYTEQDGIALACPESVFALGIGAFGASFSDCRHRFGEFLAVAGAAAYQPADGTDAPDYMIASGSIALEPRLLYGLACEGRFAHLARFERTKQKGPMGLSDLVTGCLDVAGSASAGIVIVAETVGLIGASLRRSPVSESGGHRDLFEHPGVREWLSFTSDPAFPRSTVLLAGVAHRGPAAGHLGAQLRPIGSEVSGHFHAAAFGFHPLQQGSVDLKEIVAGLFEQEELLGVLHLLRDDRSDQTTCESAFIRGACWIGPIAAAA